MTNPVEAFELIVGMLIAILVLHWAAERFRLPPSIALLVGGSALALMPGMPAVRVDPELILVMFLPPLLMDGAWTTALVGIRRHAVGVLSLAVGLVVFTTLVVAVVTHWLMPSLPWAACAALGAVVSPPDAISARAVLRRVELPRRLTTLLEGESLLNDATGLVIFRFAVAAALGGTFDATEAIGRFALLTAGGVLVGLALGMLWVATARRLREELLLIVTTALLSWVAYLTAEAVHVSGVIATVTAALVASWHQHVVFSAAVRVKGSSFWQVLAFLLEASVFMLIGFSLRDVLMRAGGSAVVLEQMAGPTLAVIAALTAARFVWIFGSDVALSGLRAVGIGGRAPLGWASGVVMSWAGMRGVVTLAVALSLPQAMPGRDFILVVAFGVILVTVIVQGSTLGRMIGWAGIRRTGDDATPMGMHDAELAMALAQLSIVERRSRDPHGNVAHPHLLERYSRRASLADGLEGTAVERENAISEHYDIIIAAVSAGRNELVRLHREHMIDEEILASLERDLDLEELVAISARN